MSFTGPRMDAGGATLDINVSARHGDVTRTESRVSGGKIPQRQNLERVASDREPIDQRTIFATIDATASWLLARQAADGH